MNGLSLLIALPAAAAGCALAWLLLRQRIETLRIEQAAVAARDQERAAQALQLEQQLSERQRKIDLLSAELAEERAQQRAQQARSEEQAGQHAARLRDFEATRERMERDFENLANRIFDERGRRFDEKSATTIGAILNPVREQLETFKKRIETIREEDIRERAGLGEQIRGLQQLNQQMNEEARNLTSALRGESKTQGDWGEMILEKVLEQSGLRKGVEYETQVKTRDAEGNLRRPDVVIRLPEEKDIVIDAKVSLSDYYRLQIAETDAQRDEALKAHCRSIDAHIRGLAGRDYSQLSGLRSLDMVLMFLPIEPAFLVALQSNPQLFNSAFQKGIVIVSPTTLLATLRVIENIWRYARQNVNATRIAERAGAVYDKLRGFVEEFEKVGAQLETARNTYGAAHKKLSEGRGNLLRQAEQFRDLGVRVKKELPAALRAGAGVEDTSPALSDEAGEQAASINQSIDQ